MALEDDIALLAGVPTIGSIERDALRLLAFSAETLVLKVGDVLFRKGEAADGGFVVVKGAIALSREEGAIALETVGSGGLIGELALISETTRPAHAVAVQPTMLLRIPRALFRRTLEEYPHVAARLAAEIYKRITATSLELGAVRDSLNLIR